MSNIAVVERCIEAISARDADTLAELSAPDVEVRPLRSILDDSVYRGRPGIDQWMHDIDDTWAELWIEIDETLEPEPDLVISKATIRARGHGSGAPTEMQVELVARLQDGLVTHAETRTRGTSTR